MRHIANKALLIVAAVVICIGAWGQKKTVSPETFAHWNRISNSQLSPDGKWLIYELNQLHGDGKLIIHNNEASVNDTIEYGSGAKISANSQYVTFKLKQPFDSIRTAKLNKVKKEKMPKDSLAIYNLIDGTKQVFANLESYKMATKSEDLMAFIQEVSVAPEDTSKKKKEKIKRLHIFNGASHLELDRIEEYTVAKHGASLAFIYQHKTDSATHTAVGVYDLRKNRIDTIHRFDGVAKKLALSHLGDKLAYMTSTDTIDEKTYKLHLYDGTKTKVVVDTLTHSNDYTASINKQPWFSDNGEKLYYGIAPGPYTQPKDTVLKSEIPKLDIWHWKDIDIQPMQNAGLKKAKKATFTAVYDIVRKKSLQLESSIYEGVSTIDKGDNNWVILENDSVYRRASSWSAEWFSDYSLLNIITKERRAIVKSVMGVRLTSNARYALWYQTSDSCVYSKDMKTGRVTNLSSMLDVAFYDEQNDTPTHPSPYEFVGFGKKNRYAYMNDRYDIWRFDLTNKHKPKNMTKKFGRDNKIRFAYVDLDRENKYVAVDEVYLRGFNEETKETGYFVTSFNDDLPPQKMLYGKYRYSGLTRAQNSDQLMWRRETIADYPNIRVGKKLANDPVVTDANPQQKEYKWAQNELVEWTSFKGEQLQGILYKPENFNPANKYPVVIYFYERNSDGLYRHYYPYPSRSTINRIHYVSNDYIVFVPDITYTTGQPGQDAYDAIVSGAMAMSDRFSWFDKTRMALQGQSWGGYQTAYLITKTNLFAAAMAGAPVSNMTSAYGGIRWGSGMSRMFQYEHTQSRIGGTLWDRPMEYIKNSPLFFAPQVQTPLLMMHNDNDGAVPWYQGIEYFMALRRLNKPAWLLVYNGEPHNLKAESWANRKDLSIRMKQFFDHYLKGELAPSWMKKGVKAVEKGKRLGYKKE